VLAAYLEHCVRDGPGSLRLDVRRLYDWPPLRELTLMVGAQSLGRLQGLSPQALEGRHLRI
jgi:hypothetical protein